MDRPSRDDTHGPDDQPAPQDRLTGEDRFEREDRTREDRFERGDRMPREERFAREDNPRDDQRPFREEREATAPRPWDEAAPRPSDFAPPRSARPWGEDRARGPRPPSGGPFRGPRPGGGRPFDRPDVDRRAPRPYIPLRPAVAADPSLALAPDEELVAGRRPVEEAFVARRESKRLYVVPQRRLALEKLVLHATSLRIPVIEVEGGTLTAIAGFDGHQGIALVVAPRRWASPEDILAVAGSRHEAPLVLVLDSLEDPQNVGTLLRTAEASGVHGAIFPTRHQAPLSPAAVKASAGAVEHLALAPVDDLPGILADLHARGLRIVGADGEAPLTARDADLRGPIVIVVGSEGKGLGPAIRRRCDLVVRIPMHGRIESLNASVAGSILLYEAAAQRRLPDPGPRPASEPDEAEPDETEGRPPQADEAVDVQDVASADVAEARAEAGGAETATGPEAEAEAVAPVAPAEAEAAGAEAAGAEAAGAEAAGAEAEPEAAPVVAEIADAPEPAEVAETASTAIVTPTATPEGEPEPGGAPEPDASAQPPGPAVSKPKATRTRRPKMVGTEPVPPVDADDLLPEGPAKTPPEV